MAAAPALQGTVLDAIDGWAAVSPAAPALLAPGWDELDFNSLASTVAHLAGDLFQRGVSRGDLVFLALPDGPPLAIAILAAMRAGIAAPLSWAMSEYEFSEALGITARALIVPTGVDTPARGAALRAGIPVLELDGDPGAGTGALALQGPRFGPAAPGTVPYADDVALVIYSSGTAGRPKRVPRTHRNITATTNDIFRVMGTGEADRCLNVAPMAFSQGLNALITAVSAGSSLVALPGPDLTRLPGWIRTFRPTWISATPTLLRAILSDHEAASAFREHPLRMIRASAGAISASEIKAIEEALQTAVVHSYGMSEASFIAGESLGALRRKPGSAGVCNHDVAILNAAGQQVPPGETGEIVTRGPNIFPGYLDDSAANAAAFTSDGWFRTGDSGHLDHDGYLFVSGRTKEMIKRGGLAISPLEVEDALLTDPAVAEACVFGVPHPLLGEEVAAAVVVRAGHLTSERMLRERVRERLAATKAPSLILFTPDLPKGPTGKVKRAELSAQVAATRPIREGDDFETTPVTALDQPLLHHLVRISAEILNLDHTAPDDDLFDLGIDSLRTSILASRVSSELGVDLPLDVLFDQRTPRRLARWLDDRAASTPLAPVTLQSGGGKRAVYFVPGGSGGSGHLLTGGGLARRTDWNRPFRGFPAEVGMAAGEASGAAWVEEMAADYVAAMRSEQPSGPYLLVGVCVGGVIAWAMASQLANDGEIGHLFLIDSRNPAAGLRPSADGVSQTARRQRRFGRRNTNARPASARRQIADGDFDRVGKIRQYVPPPIPGFVTLAANESWLRGDATLGWGDLVGDRLRVVPAGASHRLQSRLDEVAEALRAWLDSIEGE